MSGVEILTTQILDCTCKLCQFKSHDLDSSHKFDLTLKNCICKLTSSSSFVNFKCSDPGVG